MYFLCFRGTVRNIFTITICHPSYLLEVFREVLVVVPCVPAVHHL